jgi:hypothetical protein
MSVEDIVRYRLQCGIRISTVTPRHDGAGEHLNVQTKLRVTELARLRTGYLRPNKALTIAEFDLFMRTCRLKFASDPTIGRIALKSGSIIWRLAIEYVYPELVMDGPSRDAV